MQILRCGLQIHGRNECLEILFPSHLNCNNFLSFLQAKRDEMDKHLETATKEHLALVHEKLRRQQKCLEAQTESIQLQKEHIKLQRDALSTYKNDLVELRSKFADGELIWKISEFSQKWKDVKNQRSSELLVSEPFYTHKNGYKMCAGLWVNGFGSGKGRYVSVGLQVRHETDRPSSFHLARH
jgi:hypothetical protein